jgi:hypothetical protein
LENKDKTAFVASKELTTKIEKLQKELGLTSPGEVISLGLSFLELSMGREVEFHEGAKVFKTNKFSQNKLIVSLEDNG